MMSVATLGPLMPHRWPLRAGLIAGGLALFVAALATALTDPWIEVVGRATSFYLLALPVLLLAVPGTRALAREWVTGAAARWLFGAAVVGALAVDRLAQGTPAQLIPCAIYVAGALLLADRRAVAPRWMDIPLVAWLWLPLEFGLVRGDFVLLRLMGLNVLLLLFVIERPLFRLGRLVPSNRREWFWGLAMWLAFIALAIPVAEATGFATFGVQYRTAGDWSLFLVSTFLIIALPEEALFRGAIQGLLERALSNRWVAWLLASFLFGLSHLNNKIQGEPLDLRYLLLSSIAGMAYGWAYMKTGNLAAPTLTHFLVDVTWRGFWAGYD